MNCSTNPYDELPYRSCPVEWTAPERLAVASLLHGGPRPPLGRYRVLEMGCGNGANLMPLAYYRRHAGFVGVDGALSQIAAAQARKSALGLSNVEFVHADFRTASQRLSGRFDYVSRTASSPGFPRRFATLCWNFSPSAFSPAVCCT